MMQISISNAIGSRYMGASTPPIDPDAQAFITAASITDPTQQAAINTLVVDLKGYNVWTKMKALYPFVGGTATTHKFNLKNPLDTNAAFRILWSGGVTHSVNGVLFGGVNGSGDTFLNDLSNLAQNSAHCSVYSRTNAASTFAPAIGSNSYGQNGGTKLTLSVINSTFYSVHSADQPSTSNTDTRGMFIANRTTSSGSSLLIRGTITTHTQASQTPSNTTFKIGGFPSFYDNKQLAFASIGDGLTNTDMTNLTTAVQAFQTTLGRSIGTQTVSDADAQAFVTNAGIVDQVEANAVNNLVIGLKADSLWTKMKALYPMVGGSSSTMKYNLKNPLDTDAAFRLVFNGGWTFSSNGALPNGTNAYANTYLDALSTLSSTSYHISYYSRTQDTSKNAHDMGAEGFSDTNIDLYLYYNSVSAKGFLDGTYPSLAVETNNTDTTGFQIGNRTSIALMNLWWDGSKLATNTATDNRALPSLNIFIGATNTSGSGTAFSNKQCAFASIGDGLTDTDATNLNTRVTTFQTALNRNV